MERPGTRRHVIMIASHLASHRAFLAVPQIRCSNYAARNTYQRPGCGSWSTICQLVIDRPLPLTERSDLIRDCPTEMRPICLTAAPMWRRWEKGHINCVIHKFLRLPKSPETNSEPFCASAGARLSYFDQHTGLVNIFLFHRRRRRWTGRRKP